MSIVKSVLSKFIPVVLLTAVGYIAFSSSVAKQNIKDIEILDQEAQATVLDIRHEEKSDLLKGSILDYEAIYISYEFEIDERVFHKTELVKKSDSNLSNLFESYDLLKESNNKVVVRYNSKDPRKSALGTANIIASF